MGSNISTESNKSESDYSLSIYSLKSQRSETTLECLERSSLISIESIQGNVLRGPEESYVECIEQSSSSDRHTLSINSIEDSSNATVQPIKSSYSKIQSLSRSNLDVGQPLTIASREFSRHSSLSPDGVEDGKDASQLEDIRAQTPDNVKMLTFESFSSTTTDSKQKNATKHRKHFFFIL